MLARPDLVMLVLILTTLFILVYPANYLRLFIIAVSAFLVYLIIGRISENYGLGTLFSFAYIPPMLEPSKFESTLTLSQLVNVYVHHFKAIPQTTFPLYILCIGVAACHSVKHASKHIAVISMAILFYAVAHWFIMPMQKERTLAFVLIIGCVLINKLLSGHDEQVAR
jgi:di/tricarboxylate transporter